MGNSEKRFFGIPVEEIKKIVKFGITGVGNTLVDYAVFFFLAQILGVNAYGAQICSYGAGMLNSYLLNRCWTFQSQARIFGVQLLRFLIANLFVLGISILLLRFLMGNMALMLAKLVTIFVTMTLNFVISRAWVFREKK